MRWFRDLKMGYKLAVSFGLCLLLMAPLSAVSIRGMRQMNSVAAQIASDPLPGTAAIGKISSLMRQVRILDFRYILEKDTADRQKILALANQNMSEIEDALKRYEATIHVEEDRQNFRELMGAWQTYQQLRQRTFALSDQDRFKEAYRLLDEEGAKLFLERIGKRVDQMLAWNEAYGKQLAEEGASVSRQAQRVTLLMMGLSILIGVVFAFMTTRQITFMVGQIQQRLESLRSNCIIGIHRSVKAMARGDLTVEAHTGTSLIENPGKDELGRIADNVNQIILLVQETIAAFTEAQKSLGALIRQIASGADDLAASSVQLAASSDQGAHAASDIARSMREVTNAAEQSARTSQEIARGSEQQARTASETAQSMEALQRAVG